MSYHGNAQIVAVGLGVDPSDVPLPNVPSNPAEAQQWAEQQFKDYLKSEGIPLSKEDALAFAKDYAAQYGWPTTPDQAKKFLMDWAWEQAAAAGLPPEVLAARDLIENPPTNADEAAAWTMELAKRYAARYGIPISKDQLIQAAVYTATRQFGVDPAFAEVTIKALADGELSAEEAREIAVAACAWAGAVLGQAIGIPAPIGAFIGSALGGIVVDLVFSALGLTESAADRARKLEAARARWRAAQTEWNIGTLRNAWNGYLHYAASVDVTLQRLFEEYGDALEKSGGLRYYGRTEYRPGQDKSKGFLPELFGKVSDTVAQAVEQAQQKPPLIVRDCTFESGCLYFDKLSETVTIRLNPEEREAPVQSASMKCEPGAKIGGQLDARAALKFWGAQFRISPLGFTGMTDWDQIWKVSTELRGKEGQATQAALDVASKMRTEIDAAAAATAFVVRDVIRTMAWVVVNEEIQRKDALAFATALKEAEQRGAERSAVLNSVLMSVGAGAVAGWALSRLR